MKTKQKRWFASAAVAIVCVTASYVLGDTCYKGAGYDWCRNVLNVQGITVPSTMTIGGQSCTLDANSENDDLTLWGMTVADPNTGWLLDPNNTACRVAYDCNGTLTLAQFDPSTGTTLSGPWGVVFFPKPPDTTCPYSQ